MSYREIVVEWSPSQRARLAEERRVLQKYFSAFSWHYPTSAEKTFIEGKVRTRAGDYYGLRVYLSAGFPASCPDLIVSDPVPLLDRNNNALTEVDAKMHTLGERDGCTKICHCRSSLWVPANTLYKVLIKGKIWLEAYTGHLGTGYPIDQYLRTMPDA